MSDIIEIDVEILKMVAFFAYSAFGVVVSILKKNFHMLAKLVLQPCQCPLEFPSLFY